MAQELLTGTDEMVIFKQKQPIYSNKKKMKVKDFVKQFNGRAIIHVGKTHVSYVDDGKLWDIWNCEDEIIGVYEISKEIYVKKNLIYYNDPEDFERFIGDEYEEDIDCEE